VHVYTAFASYSPSYTLSPYPPPPSGTKPPNRTCSVLLFSDFFFAVLGLELRAYTLSHSTSPFLWFFFDIGSCELFAQAGFEPQSSWALSSE
jgi:hypothetical protein